ncbi:DUF883 family protein [Aliidiomarina sp. Khilg15.8]
MPAKKASTADSKVDQAASKVHEAIEKGKPADDVVRRVADSAHEAVDRMADATNSAADRIGERGQQLKHKEEEWVGTVNEYVQKNPVTSIGIAVAGGFLLSKILSKR